MVITLDFSQCDFYREMYRKRRQERAASRYYERDKDNMYAHYYEKTSDPDRTDYSEYEEYNGIYCKDDM